MQKLIHKIILAFRYRKQLWASLKVLASATASIAIQIAAELKAEIKSTKHELTTIWKPRT